MERVEREAAAAVLPPDVSRALAVLTSSRSEQALDLWVGTSRGLDGNPEVAVTWTPRSPSGASHTRGGALSVSAQGVDGKRLFDAPLEALRLAFSANPGSLQLQITLRDADGEVIEGESRFVTVPEFPEAGLTLSSPIVPRTKTVAEFRALAAAPDPVPFAGHEFVRTDRLLIRFTLYGAGAAKATVSARLPSQRQSALVTLPVTPLPGIDSTYQVDLPLASVARGDFLLSIEASNGDAHATALVPLRVTS